MNTGVIFAIIFRVMYTEIFYIVVLKIPVLPLEIFSASRAINQFSSKP